MAGTKYSSFVSIASLVKCNLGEQCLINILMNISTSALSDYFECAKIYKGASSKKKTNLVEMIIDGHITNKINKMNLADITKIEHNKILKQNEINVRLLPGHGNNGWKRKEIMASTNNGECVIRIREWSIRNISISSII